MSVCLGRGMNQEHRAWLLELHGDAKRLGGAIPTGFHCPGPVVSLGRLRGVKTFLGSGDLVFTGSSFLHH